MPDASRFCPACRRATDTFDAGPDGRPDARCPNCQSLERHRFLALLLDLLAPFLRTQVHRVLDVAPVRIIKTALTSRYGSIEYVGTDLHPGRESDLLADLTRLPLRDAGFDLLLCYHVLEHVSDDATAIRELRRVLRPHGAALIQVPRRTGEATDDGPLVPPETATRRFGQDDHVRWYGTDFEERLAAGGLLPLVVRPTDVVGADTITRLRLDRREEVWLCMPAPEAVASGGVAGDAPPRRPVGPLDGLAGALLVGRGRTVGALGPVRTGDVEQALEEQAWARSEERERHRDEVAALREQVAAARIRAEQAEKRYADLANHPAVRTLRKVKRALPGR